jgi:hypothetical protein
MSASAVLVLGACGGNAGAAHASDSPLTIYVHPGASGTGSGTQHDPYTSLSAARDALRPRLASMTADAHVVLEDGTYTLTAPFSLTPGDSGQGGHTVSYEAAPGAHPVISGGQQISGWTKQSGGVWSAPAPNGLQLRQLYVDGKRAEIAQGTLPVALTRTATGYRASSSVLGTWKNPSSIELVYPSGPSNWTESRCRIASVAGTAITMAQPCWDNTTKRTTPGTALAISGFNQPLGAKYIATNAYELLTKPGQWYLDTSAHRLDYIPLPGQDMRTATVIAPRLQTLVDAAGTADSPIHDIALRGITFSYATWLAPSGANGYSAFQAGTYLSGKDAYRNQGACDSAASSCPYAAYDQIPGNVSFRDDQRIAFKGNTFTHLGAAGLALGDGSQNDVVAGNIFTDTSGSGLTLGGVDEPLTNGGHLVSGNQIHDNYFHAVAAEYQDSAALFVGYAQYTTITHNQIDDVPYSGISIGWGGWRERFAYLGPLSNYSRGNVISSNLIFDHMQTLVDGGAIYSNGIEGSSMADAEQITGNVVLNQIHPSWGIYTDNGTQFVRVGSNVVWGALYVPLAPHYLPGVSPYFSFGGCGGGPIDYDGNYSLQAAPPAGLISANDACGGHPLVGVTVESNHVISALGQVPSSVLSSAGITAPYRAVLAPVPAPVDVPAYNQYGPP